MDNEPMNGVNNTAAKLTGMIGLARRAGKLNYGFDAVVKDIEAHKTKAVLLSNDASPRTAGKTKEECERFRARIVVLPVSKALLGGAIGKGDIAVIAISDKSFADRILELASAASRSDLDEQTDSGGN
jgi:ribosomal protein L7Ae-like RNA K-turn-binding protein